MSAEPHIPHAARKLGQQNQCTSSSPLPSPPPPPPRLHLLRTGSPHCCGPTPRCMAEQQATHPHPHPRPMHIRAYVFPCPHHPLPPSTLARNPTHICWTQFFSHLWPLLRMGQQRRQPGAGPHGAICTLYTDKKKLYTVSTEHSLSAKKKTPPSRTQHGIVI